MIRGSLAALAAGAAALAAALVAAEATPAVECAWTPASNGLAPRAYVVSLAAGREPSASVYVGTTLRGLYRTIDGGDLWTPLAKTFPLLDGELVAQFGADVSAIAPDPRDPRTIYVGTAFAGALKSQDGGRTWRILDGLNGRGGGDLAGLVGVLSLAIDPVEPRLVYAGLRGRGIYRSEDAGEHWTPARGADRIDVGALAIDVRRRTRVYAATSTGVLASDDGGRSWRRSSRGIGRQPVWSLAVDPATTGVVYAGTPRGVFRSEDGGRSWLRASAGLAGGNVRSLVVDPRRPGRVFAGTSGGVYRSNNRASSWRRFGTGLGGRVVQALALSAGPAPALFAGTQGSGVFMLACLSDG